MDIDEVIRTLQDLKAKHGRLRVLMDYEDIQQIVFVDGITEENELPFINFEK